MKELRSMCVLAKQHTAAGQADVKELRSMSVLAEQQIAAGQAELAAAQDHAHLLQEMLDDAQVCPANWQTFIALHPQAPFDKLLLTNNTSRSRFEIDFKLADASGCKATWLHLQ